MSLLQWHEWVCNNDSSKSASIISMSLLQWLEWVYYNDIYNESATMTFTMSLLQWHEWVCLNDSNEFASMTYTTLSRNTITRATRSRRNTWSMIYKYNISLRWCEYQNTRRVTSLIDLVYLNSISLIELYSTIFHIRSNHDRHSTRRISILAIS